MHRLFLAISALMPIHFALPAYAKASDEAVRDLDVPISVAIKARLERDQAYNISQTSGGIRTWLLAELTARVVGASVSFNF